jgi:hypothetical protein
MLQAFEWVSEWKTWKNDFFIHKSHEWRTLIRFPFHLFCQIVSQYTLDPNWLVNRWIPSGRTYVTGIVWVGVRVENLEKQHFHPQIAWTMHLDPLSFWLYWQTVSQHTLDANWLFNQCIPSCRTYVMGVWVGVRMENLQERLFRLQVTWTTPLDLLSFQPIVLNSKPTYFRCQLVVQSMNSEW